MSTHFYVFCLEVFNVQLNCEPCFGVDNLPNANDLLRTSGPRCVLLKIGLKCDLVVLVGRLIDASIKHVLPFDDYVAWAMKLDKRWLSKPLEETGDVFLPAMDLCLLDAQPHNDRSKIED